MDIKIVPFEYKYTQAFKAINEAWIARYFKVEAQDKKVLDHPKSYILDKGGHIFVALLQNEPVGVCALIKMNHPEFDYELAKMGVSPKAQGLGIGLLLGKACINKARDVKAKTIYLESNSILKPAISLYKKLGFTEISGIATPYQRCDIQMALHL